MSVYQELLDKKAKIAVIGLGYVGLPIALEFAKRIPVIGFDINDKRIDMMKKHIIQNICCITQSIRIFTTYQ